MEDIDVHPAAWKSPVVHNQTCHLKKFFFLERKVVELAFSRSIETTIL
jgi:hypothetical protein